MELLELPKVMPMTTRSLGSTPVFSAICAGFSVALCSSNIAVARESIVLEARVCLEAELRRDVVDETTEIRNSFFFLSPTFGGGWIVGTDTVPASPKPMEREGQERGHKSHQFREMDYFPISTPISKVSSRIMMSLEYMEFSRIVYTVMSLLRHDEFTQLHEDLVLLARPVVHVFVTGIARSLAQIR